MKKHLAGIVPVSGLKSNFDMPWHESLMPLAPNYLAVERAVAECAYAGCDSIWVVCKDNVTPLIRYQIGEKIQDPVYNYRHFEVNKNDVKKPIRIYYVPLAIKDINKRDNLAWSAIFGAQTAHNILSRLSGHLSPNSFYISWPYGYYDPWLIREHRKALRTKHALLCNEGESVRENKYLALTLDIQQINLLVSESITTSSGLWAEDRKNKLAVEDRYSYRNFNLQEVFKNLDFSDYERINIENYKSIDSWENYCNFISIYKGVKKPSLLKYSEWNKIGVDDV